MNEPQDVIFKAGTILHYKGIPFRAPQDITLQGSQANREMVDQEFPDGGAGRDGQTVEWIGEPVIFDFPR